MERGLQPVIDYDDIDYGLFITVNPSMTFDELRAADIPLLAATLELMDGDHVLALGDIRWEVPSRIATRMGNDVYYRRYIYLTKTPHADVDLLPGSGTLTLRITSAPEVVMRRPTQSVYWDGSATVHLPAPRMPDR